MPRKYNYTKKTGRPTKYKPEYAQKIVEFFSPPHYTIKKVTVTSPDGKKSTKLEKEAMPPLFLSDFARSIGISLLGYRDMFSAWAEKHPDFSVALKDAKEFEVDRIRINTTLGLYPAQAFCIFTLKNIAGWRDTQELTGKDGESLATKIIHINHNGHAEKDKDPITRLGNLQVA